MNISRPTSPTQPTVPDSSLSEDSPASSSQGASVDTSASVVFISPDEHAALAAFLSSRVVETTKDGTVVKYVEPPKSTSTTAGSPELGARFVEEASVAELASITSPLAEAAASLAIKDVHTSEEEYGSEQPTLTKNQKKKLKKKQKKLMVAESSDVITGASSQSHQTKTKPSPNVKRRQDSQDREQAESVTEEQQKTEEKSKAKIKHTSEQQQESQSTDPKPETMLLPETMVITPMYGHYSFTVMQPSVAFLEALTEHCHPTGKVGQCYNLINQFALDIRDLQNKQKAGVKKVSYDLSVKRVQRRTEEIKQCWIELHALLKMLHELADKRCGSYAAIEAFTNSHAQNVAPYVDILHNLFNASFASPHKLDVFSTALQGSMQHLYSLVEVLTSMQEAFSKGEGQTKPD